MNARTQTLFHFTKSLDVLLRILEEGFWPQYSLEDLTWLNNPKAVPRIAWPMVSFCDIPISRLREHIGTYGNYGIGVCRQQWTAAGLNPILYVSPDSLLRDFLSELLLESQHTSDRRKRTAGMVLLAHCKPLKGTSEIDGTTRTTDYYSECEWRFIPWVEVVGGEKNYSFFLKEDQFRDKGILATANDERRRDQMLRVWPDAVRYLLVRTREEVPKVMNFIDSKIVHPKLVKDMLKTRIIVWEEISGDL